MTLLAQRELHETSYIVREIYRIYSEMSHSWSFMIFLFYSMIELFSSKFENKLNFSSPLCNRTSSSDGSEIQINSTYRYG